MTETPSLAPPPRANADLVGHEAAEKELVQAFRAGQLAHAWLFAGPRGIGKATLAFRLARFLLRDGRAEVEAPSLHGFDGPVDSSDGSLYVAPDTPLFHRVASGGHADLLTIERDVDQTTGKTRSEVVAGDVRRIGWFFAQTAAEGGWRAVVIDAADDMNRHAANAALKVLEEPPERTVLILVSHNPGRLPPTIRSRCRRLVLRPLAENTVVELIGRYRPEMDATQAQYLARLSGGSIGRALDLADGGGVTLYRDLLGLLADLPRIDTLALHRFADSVGRDTSGDAFRIVVDVWRVVLSRVIRLIATSDEAGACPDAHERQVAHRLAEAAGLDCWLKVWDKSTSLLARADRVNLDRKQVILNVFLDLEIAIRR